MFHNVDAVVIIVDFFHDWILRVQDRELLGFETTSERTPRKQFFIISVLRQYELIIIYLRGIRFNLRAAQKNKKKDLMSKQAPEVVTKPSMNAQPNEWIFIVEHIYNTEIMLKCFTRTYYVRSQTFETSESTPRQYH